MEPITDQEQPFPEQSSGLSLTPSSRQLVHPRNGFHDTEYLQQPPNIRLEHLADVPNAFLPAWIGIAVSEGCVQPALTTKQERTGADRMFQSCVNAMLALPLLKEYLLKYEHISYKSDV